MLAAKLGATAYALWSVQHISLGAARLIDKHQTGALGDAGGMIAQHHWALISVGAFGLYTSFWNWRNHPLAYWAAAYVISAEDIGFIVFRIGYGSMEFPAAAIGPGLWLAGLMLTSIARFSANPGSRGGASAA